MVGLGAVQRQSGEGLGYLGHLRARFSGEIPAKFHKNFRPKVSINLAGISGCGGPGAFRAVASEIFPRNTRNFLRVSGRKSL